MKRAAGKLDLFMSDLFKALIARPLVYWDDTVVMADKKRICLQFYGEFEVDSEQLGDGFNSDSCEKWDSVTQMALITSLENAFDIMIDMDDIYEFNSFHAGIEIMRKYEVEI